MLKSSDLDFMESTNSARPIQFLMFLYGEGLNSKICHSIEDGMFVSTSRERPKTFLRTEVTIFPILLRERREGLILIC